MTIHWIDNSKPWMTIHWIDKSKPWIAIHRIDEKTDVKKRGKTHAQCQFQRQNSAAVQCKRISQKRTRGKS